MKRTDFSRTMNATLVSSAPVARGKGELVPLKLHDALHLLHICAEECVLFLYVLGARKCISWKEYRGEEGDIEKVHEIARADPRHNVV